MSSGLGFTAYYSRRAIKWFAIGVVVYLVLYIVWTVAKPYFERPDPPPPIIPKFGRLPELDFPPPDPDLKFTYKLETITGGLPTDIPDRVVIFFNQAKKASFLDYNQARSLAQSYGFESQPIPVSPPIYQWRKVTGTPAILEINSTSMDFDLVRNWHDQQRLLQSNQRITNKEVFNAAQNSLATGVLWNEDLDKGGHSFIYFKAFKDQLVKVSSISEADLIQVNFSQSQINKLPIVHADPERPPIWALVNRGGGVTEIHYRYFPTGKDKSEYPIKSTEKAWEDLISGRAHIARVGENYPGEQVIIREISLAYYVSNKYQDFTQAVYLIRGDKNFMALTQAVDPSVLVKK